MDSAKSELVSRRPQQVPGTQQLIDVDKNQINRHAQGKNDIILLPTPSQDPDDPLNWSPRRKALATLCWCVYTLANGIAGSNLASVLVPFSEARGLSESTLNSGTGYLFLLAGWGLLFWQPFALQYGKRITYIFTLLAILAMSVWAPYITSEGQWYARSVLIGFFASPIEALPELSVADLYFAHERGNYMALYAFTLVGSNFVSPIICGFINDGQGWQWVFYWPAIFCGAGAVFLFFFMEETNFDRKPNDEQQEMQYKDMVLNGSDIEKDERQQAGLTKKSYLKKLSLKDKSRPFIMHKRFIRQLLFLTWPIPVYGGFAYGSTLIWFNVLNATASSILGAAPYNFSASIVGLTYVAPLIGTTVGFLFNGRFSDYIVVRLSRRNGGIMEPEYRLWLFAVSTILIPSALILWGVGSVHHVHWVGLLFAMAMFGFINTCGASLGVNYLVDCYREMSGDALTALIIVRNTMSFAINYGITPWIQNLGQQNAFISAAFIGMAASTHFLFMMKWGKKLRSRSSDKYWRLVKKTAEQGIIH